MVVFVVKSGGLTMIVDELRGNEVGMRSIIRCLSEEMTIRESAREGICLLGGMNGWRQAK